MDPSKASAGLSERPVQGSVLVLVFAQLASVQALVRAAAYSAAPARSMERAAVRALPAFAGQESVPMRSVLLSDGHLRR